MQFAQPTISGIQSNINQLSPYTQPNQAIPSEAFSTSQMMYNNPYAPQLQAGAGTASQLGEAAAANQFNIGNQLIPGASQILTTGFDPENALRARMQQQVVDQTSAALS